LRYCRTPNDAPEAPFLRSNRRIDSNYFRFKAKSLRVDEELKIIILSETSGRFQTSHLEERAGRFHESSQDLAADPSIARRPVVKQGDSQ
jgi:hypothetical protein